MVGPFVPLWGTDIFSFIFYIILFCLGAGEFTKILIEIQTLGRFL